jgi:ectoine hydroxylase-related dioxygenase (phytanoyl-CoA dioxygenase family)
MHFPANAAAIYASDGYLTDLDVFTQEEIGYYRQCFDELEAREGREKCQIGLQAWHLKEQFIWDMSIDKRVVDAMQELMGDDIMLLSTHFFCKYPVTDQEHFVAWHQDITYWGLEPPIADTAWIAIDDSDVENGCMQVIPSSHKNGIAPHDSSERDGNLLSINQEIPDEHVDKSNVVNLCLKAGQMSIHTGQIFHASNPNKSKRRRCGLTVRFIPPHARQADLNSLKTQWQPILLRGEDRHHHYPETPMPFPAKN